MATYLYDEALLHKIKGWTHTTKITVLGVNETTRLFEQLGDENNDEPIKLPLIAISRNRGYSIINGGTGKRMMSYEGVSYDRNIYNEGTEDAYTTTGSISAIPISISYQLDVYTRFAKEADVLMRNLIFNIVNYPMFEIEIPTAHIKHTARFVLSDNVEDNSDVPERFVAGNFTRLSVILTVDDAYLWDVRELRDTAIDVILDDSNEPWVWNEDGTKVEFPDLSQMQHFTIPDPTTLKLE